MIPRGSPGRVRGPHLGRWGYPDAQNRGAQRWRVRLSDFEVVEDAEPDDPGPDLDGVDWRMFFNVNNRDREWTKVFDCDDCVDEDDVKRLDLATGGAQLGPDPVLFARPRRSSCTPRGSSALRPCAASDSPEVPTRTGIAPPCPPRAVRFPSAKPARRRQLRQGPRSRSAAAQERRSGHRPDAYI